MAPGVVAIRRNQCDRWSGKKHCPYDASVVKNETRMRPGAEDFTKKARSSSFPKLTTAPGCCIRLGRRAGCSRAPDSVSRGLLVISERFPRFTRTALDVGGPCVGAFGCIQEKAHLPRCKAANSKKLHWNHFKNRWHAPRFWLRYSHLIFGDGVLMVSFVVRFSLERVVISDYRFSSIAINILWSWLKGKPLS